MRRHRGPMSDPRDGKTFRLLRHAFAAHERPKTRTLVNWVYHDAPIKPWMRRHVIKMARKVATPTRLSRKGASSGRSFVWQPVPELMEERSPTGRWRRRPHRRGTA
jgi:hypothetical protein